MVDKVLFVYETMFYIMVENLDKLRNFAFRNLKILAYNDGIPECPKPCKYLMIDFGRSSTSEIEWLSSELIIRFRKYIKVSKVSYTYQGLELFAEVGGYLGLFLGISISQLPGLIATFVQRFKK